MTFQLLIWIKNGRSVVDMDQGRSGGFPVLLSLADCRITILLPINMGEFEMHMITKLFLASTLALSIAGPVQAQSPTQGDYYAPGPTTHIQATPEQLKRNQQGDYYVGDKTVLNSHRMAALKKCTHNIAFESDRYVACMSKEGESP
jgi:hypothetical protein